MSQKPETSFSKLLQGKVNRDVHFEKTSNNFKKGIPDFYIEGPNNILWLEVKWIPKPWTTDREASKICPTTSWVNQRHWLERAHKNGKQAYVIIGIGKGRDTKGYILSYPYAFSIETTMLLPISSIAEWVGLKVL